MSHQETRKGRGTKVALSLLVLLLIGAVAGFGTWAAFSDTATNTGNNFVAGSVDIDDNDTGTALYNSTTNAKPGDRDDGCIVVTYNGSLDSTVRLFSADTLNNNNLKDYLTLTITSGTGAATPTDCSAFVTTQTTGNIYNGTLANFMATKNSFTNGVALDAGGNAVWSTGESVTYKFEVTLQDNNLANAGNVADSGTGYQTGVHSFTWEARNN
jgi:predicted ribosomally synthesized peptide with SipW-like signal peptide